MQKNLTQNIINRSKVPSKRTRLWDSEVKELYYRIDPNGSSAWIIRYYAHSPKQVGEKPKEKVIATGSVTLCDARIAAKKYLGEIIKNGIEPLPARAKKTSKTLREIYEEYEKTELQGRDKAGIRNNIKIFSEYFDKPVETLTTAEILQYCDRERKSATIINPKFLSKERQKMIADKMPLPGVSAHTCNLRVRELHRCLRWALDRNLIENDPLKTWKKIPEKNLPNKNFLQNSEFSTLYNYLTDRETIQKYSDYWRPAIVTAAFTGLRRSALLALRWSDIEWETYKIKVEHDKAGNIRRMDLHKFVAQELRSWREAKQSGTSETDRIFGPQAINYKQWHKIIKASGIKYTRWHDLRHTFGTWLMSRGVPIKDVMTEMGHRNITTTSNYLHAAPERNSISKLSDFVPTECQETTNQS